MPGRLSYGTPEIGPTLAEAAVVLPSPLIAAMTTRRSAPASAMAVRYVVPFAAVMLAQVMPLSVERCH